MKNIIQLLIQENFLSQAYYDLCIFYGNSPFALENEFQKQDRLIANIYCFYNLKIQYPIEKVYSERKDKNYREYSWNFIFSLYNKKTLKNTNFNKLSDLEKQDYFIHQANLFLNPRKLFIFGKNFRKFRKTNNISQKQTKNLLFKSKKLFKKERYKKKY